MAYNFTKLSDVDLVESTSNPNLLVEDNGEIKRISAAGLVVPQVKADWDEDDPNSAAFILNKPELSSGNANVITYTLNSNSLMLDGSVVSKQAVLDAWNNGSILRINNTYAFDDYGYGYLGTILDIYYYISYGSLYSLTIYYTKNGNIQSVSIS